MARTPAWESHMRRATEQLSRACAEAASQMSGGSTSVKEIKDLAAAMKELTAMYATRKKADAPTQPKKTVRVLRVHFEDREKPWQI